MKTITLLYLIILIIIPSIVLSAEEKKDAHPINVSIINLISTPEKYHEKEIIIRGCATFKYEGDAKYLSENDAKYGIRSNGIWLKVYKTPQYKEYKKLHGKHIQVRGIFDMNMKGNRSAYAGTIKEITRIYKLLNLWKL